MNPILHSTFDKGLQFSGRSFSARDLRLIVEIAGDFSALSRTELANTVCELLEWKRPNGKLKYKECRALLERLQAGGHVCLPASRELSPRRRRTIIPSADTDAQAPLNGTVGDYLPLLLRRVDGKERSSIWKQFIQRYHYLGFRVPFGANLRYLVESQQRPGQYLSCLLFSSPAWKMAPRDAWVGWSMDERRRNLQYVVSNSRYLIFPWVSIRGLASTILSLAARQLPLDWEQLYGYRPLLLETLVDSSRFRGTCYRAANWIHLGRTQGRGRMDQNHQAHGRALKDIYVFPLCRNVCQRLRHAPTLEAAAVPHRDLFTDVHAV
jgi:Domain of unknown function (DUF4338)